MTEEKPPDPEQMIALRKPVELAKRSAEVVPLRNFPEKQPDRLKAADAIKLVRALASETENIVVIPYGKKKGEMRGITRRQMELCVQKGTLTEGPFLNPHGNWQFNMYRHAAGEEITCVVAIEWARRVLVINAF